MVRKNEPENVMAKLLVAARNSSTTLTTNSTSTFKEIQNHNVP